MQQRPSVKPMLAYEKSERRVCQDGLVKVALGANTSRHGKGKVLTDLLF
jgi:hypothetical protein